MNCCRRGAFHHFPGLVVHPEAPPNILDQRYRDDHCFATCSKAGLTRNNSDALRLVAVSISSTRIARKVATASPETNAKLVVIVESE